MKVKINLERDSDNSHSGEATLTAIGPALRIELENPSRLIEIDGEDLLKVLSILF